MLPVRGVGVRQLGWERALGPESKGERGMKPHEGLRHLAERGGRHICALSGALPCQKSRSDATAEHLTSGGSPSQQFHLPNHVKGGKGVQEEGSGGDWLWKGSRWDPAGTCSRSPAEDGREQ